MRLSTGEEDQIQSHIVCHVFLMLKKKYQVKKILFAGSARYSTDRAKWANGALARDPRSLIWYTDGSKMESGVGAGVFGPNTKLSIPMGSCPSVFQAEVHAIEICADLISRKGIKGARIIILSDSQAALQALSSNMMDSMTVKCCHDALQALARYNKVKLGWVPGHQGIAGNESADELARAGSESVFLGPEPFCRVNWASALGQLNDWEHQLRLNHWENVPGLRQSKRLIKPYSYKEILNLDKESIRKLAGFLTGHCGLRYHLNKMDICQDKDCRFCLEEDETSEHILCECPALHWLRIRTLHREILTSVELKGSATKDVLAFIREVVRLLD